MAALSFRSAARIAIRELRSSRGKFLFVIVSVAIGVAALTGVRGFSASFRSTLLLRARSIMAADLSARMYQQPTPDEQRGLDQLERTGVRITPVTELLSMASSPRTMEPLLVSLKAVDPAEYPFYGEVDLAAGPHDKKPQLRSVLTPDTVVVADDLLIRLHLHDGDSVKLGNKIFRIAAVVTNEPDRLSGSFAAGPRVILSRAGLAASGLLAPGSHATQRFLFKLPSPPAGTAIPDSEVDRLKQHLQDLLPQAQVIDYRETNPALSQGLDRATALLSLMSLVALVLGAVGVAMAMRAHLAQRLDTIAVMKSLGARSSHIVRIYLLQTLLLGLLGGLLGVALGVGVQLLFPPLISRLINIPVELHVQTSTVLTGLAAGVLITLLFTLPPLLDIRSIRPILILRREMEEEQQTLTTLVFGRLWNGRWVVLGLPVLLLCLGALRFHSLRGDLRHLGPLVLALFAAGAVGQTLRSPAVRKRLVRNPAQIAAGVLILAGLAVVATTLSDSVEVGQAFSVGLALVLLALVAASAVLLAALRGLLDRTRLRLPSALRHGLANLYRPGNPSAALLAAIGLGVMQIGTVFLVQRAVVGELHLSAAPNLPNVFLVDIASDEIAGVRSLLAQQQAVTAPPEFVPVVSSRLLGINGVDAEKAKLRNLPRRMLRSMSLTWSPGIPPGLTVVQGHWWTAVEAQSARQHPLIAINQTEAQRLGVGVGSTLTFAAEDSQLTAVVSAITHSDGQHAFSRAEFVLPPAALAGLPAVWYGGVHASPARVSEVQRALFRAFPTVTVINVAAALETVRGVVLQIIYVIQFLAAFSIFAGIVILASSVAGTRYRRIREVVVLKTLGATRGRVVTIFSIEFAVLGLVAGVVGLVAANLLALVLLHQLHVRFRLNLPWNALALLGVMLLTVITGWVASFRILGQKPLEVLREQ